jgi:hypothetical protein
MDAGKLVKQAKNWKTVPEHFNCTAEQESLSGDLAIISAASEKSYTLDASSCSEIIYIEHLQVMFDKVLIKIVR